MRCNMLSVRFSTI